MQDSLPAGGLRLYREGVEPSGSLRKVSGHIPFSFPGLRLPQGLTMTSRRSLAPRTGSPHRVAISNRRLVAFDENGVTFRYKDYRRDGPDRQRVMTLPAHEFIRR